MNASVEILVLPYDSADGKSLLHRLIAELLSGKWKRFRAAVAFAKESGNSVELLDALVNFASAGNSLSLTFGADVFAGNTKGSDLAAVETLLARLGEFENTNLYLYHENGRSFHPKMYLFDEVQSNRALVIVGSSNWSHGGLFSNVEINVVVHLNLTDEAHREVFARLESHFEAHWSES